MDVVVNKPVTVKAKTKKKSFDYSFHLVVKMTLSLTGEFRIQRLTMSDYFSFLIHTDSKILLNQINAFLSGVFLCSVDRKINCQVLAIVKHLILCSSRNDSSVIRSSLQ